MDAIKALQGMRDGDWMMVIDALDKDRVLVIDDHDDEDDRCQLSIALIGRTMIMGKRIGNRYEADIAVHRDEHCARQAFEEITNKNRAFRFALVAGGAPGADKLTFTVDGKPDPIPPGLIDQALGLGDRIRERLGMVVPDDVSALLGQ